MELRRVCPAIQQDAVLASKLFEPANDLVGRPLYASLSRGHITDGRLLESDGESDLRLC